MSETEIKECDYCSNTTDLIQMGSDLICPSCKSKGIYLPDDNSKRKFKDRVNQAPININEVLRQSRDIDGLINVRTDLFNAATKSIIELKQAIDSDDAIDNKPYALAQELLTRLTNWKKIVFELNEKVVDAQNNQRAIQSHLNQLANQLREDEREKLKLVDINYKPHRVKPISTRNIRLAKPNLKDVRHWCKELNVPEFVVQQLVISRSLTAEQAARLVRKNMDEVLVKSSNETNEVVK